MAVVGLASGGAAISAGTNHSCALLSDGSVRCWGSNASGMLGDDVGPTSAIPIGVTGLSGNAAQVEAGHLHTCVRLVDGTVECFGANEFGQLGFGQYRSSSPLWVAGFASTTPALTPVAMALLALALIGAAAAVVSRRPAS